MGHFTWQVLMHHAYAIAQAKDEGFLILHLRRKDEEESVRLGLLLYRYNPAIRFTLVTNSTS